MSFVLRPAYFPGRALAGWLLLAGCCLGPLLLERQPVAFVSPRSTTGCVLVGLVLGALAFLRSPAPALAPGRTLALAGLAGLLTLWHALLVDSHPARWDWQQQTYLDLLNHTHGPPHQYRLLPYGFVRLLERLTGDWAFSCLAYRWFFTFWFLHAAATLAGRFLPGRTAWCVPLLTAALYPLSVTHYFGQLTDPLSHALFALGVVYIVEGRVWDLAAALFLGVLAKETAALLVPGWLAWRYREGLRAGGGTLFLGVVALASFLAARLPFGWRPGTVALNGAGLMVTANLGVGNPDPWSTVSLLENYLHPLVFFGPFACLLLLRRRSIPPRLLALASLLPSLVLASNVCFGWLYESRNYVPVVPLLATAALATRDHSRRCNSSGA